MVEGGWTKSNHLKEVHLSDGLLEGGRDKCNQMKPVLTN